MAMNNKVYESSVNYMNVLEDFGYDSFEATQARDLYFETVEEQAQEQGEDADGWLGYEDSRDAIWDSIIDQDDRETVKYMLADYLRFHSILIKVYGKSNDYDSELVDEAQKYIQCIA